MDSKGDSELFDGKAPGDASRLEIINVKKFLESRAPEIEEMFGILKQSDKQERAFQKLPFVMRRRAMSHNPFKIPKSIRIHILREMAKNTPKAPKNYSTKQPNKLPQVCKRIRKDRRKKLNRLEEYQQRYRKNKWLETHLYHAKRFKMDSVWGYRLALTSTQKSKRRFLRYLKQRCVIHDRSYVEVLSVSGAMSDLRDCFKHLFSDHALMFQPVYLSGRIRGSTFCYSPNNAMPVDFSNGKGPELGNAPGLNPQMDLLAPINYIWVPAKESEEKRTIWLFIHPVASSQLSEALSQNHKLSVEPVDHLVKFELFGPLSLLLAKNVLKLDPEYAPSNRLWASVDSGFRNVCNGFTLPLFINMPKVYGNCRFPAYLRDPVPSASANEPLRDLDDSELSLERLKFFNYKSEQYEFKVKNVLRNRRRRDYGKMVSKLLQSMTYNRVGNATDAVTKEEKGRESDQMDVKEEVEEASEKPVKVEKIPILLVLRNRKPLGLDILMPGNRNASQLWILLNRSGGLSFGLYERHLLFNRFDGCSFPEDFPETSLGLSHYDNVFSAEKLKYVRTPASKRVNHSFLGVDNTFALPLNLQSQTVDFSPNIPSPNTRNPQPSLFKSKYLLLTSLCSGMYHSPSNQNINVLRLTNCPYNTHNLLLSTVLSGLLSHLKSTEGVQSNNTKERLRELIGGDYYVAVKLESFKGALNLLSRLYKLEPVDLKTIPPESLRSLAANKNFKLNRYMRVKEPHHDEYKMPNLKTTLATKSGKTLDQARVQSVLSELNQRGIKTSRTLVGFVTSKDMVETGIGCVNLLELMSTLYELLIQIKDDRLNRKLSLENLRVPLWFRDRDSREYYLAVASLVVHDVLTGTF